MNQRRAKWKLRWQPDGSTEQDVIPLFLVPAFLFAGYAVADAGFKVWAAMTIAITILLTLLYALP